MTFGATMLTLYPEMLAGRFDMSVASLDTEGHYSRPDMFELSVATGAKDGVNWR